MEYFKHYCDAQHSESLSKLLIEDGFEMYGRYWRLLEFLGGKFDGESTSFRYHRQIIRELLRVQSWTKLGTIAERLATVRGLVINQSGFVFEIEAPILLDLMSRDFKRARSERADSAPKNKIENKSKEEEKEVEPPANLGALDALFSGRIGEHTYKRISPQTKQVWLELYGSDLNFIARSFISAFAKWSSRLPKDQGVPDTFFTTQLQYDWPHHVRHKSKNQKTEPSGGLLTDWADEKEA